ncbi:MAG: class I SAM-dependent methyltransferase [Archangium sp.]
MQALSSQWRKALSATGDAPQRVLESLVREEQAREHWFTCALALRSLHETADVAHEARRVAGRMYFDVMDSAPTLPDARYEFTTDFGSEHQARWRDELAHLVGRPDIHALEVGSFEGRSACWWLENILTHPTSTLTCVDTFSVVLGGVIYDRHDTRFDRNMARTGAAHRVRKLKGRSRELLPHLTPASFDFVYVDGAHHVAEVMFDALLVWPLLRDGGTLIFDDYALGREVRSGLSARAPGFAIDAFLTLVPGQFELLHRGWQLSLRKTRGESR